MKKYLHELLDSYTGDNLMNIIEEIQRQEKVLSKETLKIVSEKLNIPLAKLYSMASFYSFFSLDKQGKNIIRVCDCISCHMHKSNEIIKAIEEVIHLQPGESNDKFSFEKVQCIGCCDNAPAMLLNDEPYENLTKEKVKEILSKIC